MEHINNKRDNIFALEIEINPLTALRLSDYGLVIRYAQYVERVKFRLQFDDITLIPLFISRYFI